MRKIVCATNVAEASVTIDGIVYAVDCMHVKMRWCDHGRIDEHGVHYGGGERLVVAAVSRSAAQQRAGRAGRVHRGQAYRLCTEADFYNDRLVAPSTVPEIQRTDVSAVVLLLKALGVDNVLRFDYLSPPPVPALAYAMELLYALGALDRDGHLTPTTGARMAEMPCAPMCARMLLAAGEHRCADEALTIAASLQVRCGAVDGAGGWGHGCGPRDRRPSTHPSG